MSTVASEDGVVALHEACDPYLGHAEISLPYFGLASIRIPVYSATVSGSVLPASAGIDNANEMRLHLLGRAHELMASLAAAGWILEGDPAMEFRSRLHQATVTLTRELVEPPSEDAIELRISLPVTRVTLPASGS